MKALVLMGINKIKVCLKNLLPKWIVTKLANSQKLQRVRYWLDYQITIRSKLIKQLSNQKKYVALSKGESNFRVLLPLIETSHYQYLQLLILAKALEVRGVKVKVLVCGQSLDGCELKSIRNERDNDPCWKCRFNEKKILPLFGLEIIKLNDVLAKHEIDAFGIEAAQLVATGEKRIVRFGVNLYQSIEDSVVRYFYGAVPGDVERVERIREAHTKTALMSIEVAARLDGEWAPQVVLSNMPCYSAWEAYYRYFQSGGNRYCQIAMSAFNFNSIVYNSFDLFPATNRFNKYLRSRDNCNLTVTEREQLQQFLDKRISGKDDLFIKDKYFSQQEHAENVEQKLNYDKTKRNIFLFSNLYWDVGLSDRSGLFSGVLDWVVGTIEILKSEPNCHLYIKPHPAEFFGSAGSLKGVSQVIRERYANTLTNLTIIEPDWKLNTYQLFPLIDIGVIFTGTLGLEMMLAGIPVISTGTTSHKGLGFSAEPETLDSYRSHLLGETKPPEIKRSYLELFAYFYFIRTLIPWTLTKRAYADDFDGFNINNLGDLRVGRDAILDHLCNCILDPENTVPEAWQAECISTTNISTELI